MATSSCSHVTRAVGRLSRADLAQLLASQACDVCRRGPAATNLWLCLAPDCYMLGCAEKRSDHSTQHNLQHPDHCIQLNVTNMRAWCYACRAEVVLARNTPPVRGALGAPASEEREEEEGRGLVGLSNLGNTCYMNSALQCLSNTPALTRFFLTCPELVPRDVKPALGLAYGKLVTDLWQGGQGAAPYVAPTGVLHAVKQAWPAFRGFQQHDAQEFLRCAMDQLHRELCEPIPEEEAAGDAHAAIDALEESASGAGSETGEEQYETADSEASEARRAEGSEAAGRKRKAAGRESGDRDSGLGSLASTNSRLSKHSRLPASPSDHEYSDAASEPPSPPPQARGDSAAAYPELRRHHARRYRSVITDIFDGALVSSVKCLTCDTVSKTAETFQDLSLPIPSPETVGTYTREGQGWGTWVWEWIASWFYGPDVSLLDCLSCFFSADELKGDNMYSCEKCNKLRNGLKYSQVTELPDTLCIHLKRFRHDFAFSSKIGTRVQFEEVVDMSPWLHAECSSRERTYRLSGVVCHHGTSGGGHYTCYNYNHVSATWHEFDDSIVREVSLQTVLASEAYVLFYRKSSEGMEVVRREVERLSSQHSKADSLVVHYIANSWLAKFATVAEPGPIDNSSVICRHGGVRHNRVETAAALCTAVPREVWTYLHSTFGGPSAVTKLQPCQICLAAAAAEQRQKEFELAEFKMLHSEEGGERDQGGDRFCLTATWFRAWEAWVCGRAKEPPGPINNRSIVVQRPHGLALRPHTDHFKFSEDIWSMFVSLYGGGPEILVAAGGGVTVRPPRPATISALAQRLRARSESQREELEESAA